ncbi:Na(+)/H(+) antiporter nhaA 2, partial [human gut metagenome]
KDTPAFKKLNKGIIKKLTQFFSLSAHLCIGYTVSPSSLPVAGIVIAKIIKMPTNTTWPEVYGTAIICGIGFTM